MIKYYLVLNQLSRGNLENAQVLFRQIDYELRDMRFFDELYKQNGAARFLTAIVAQNLGNFNDARVQLRNLQEMFPEREKEIGASQYVLAIEEGVLEDQEAYGHWADEVPAFNAAGERVPYRKGMAEVVFMNYAGQGAVKNSRGRIREEPRLFQAFYSNLGTRPEVRDSLYHIMQILADAENPIPEYVRRDPAGSRRVGIVSNGAPLTETEPFFSYSETVLRNFNDHYDDMIKKNIDSLSSKVAVAVMAGETLATAANVLNIAAAARGIGQQLDADDARRGGAAVAAG